ncbi:MAG: glycine zipper family protein [Gammaproteobacteria bacterium]|nr:glycine zipper family protein [Gammaproteobacteria bacterium]
MRRLAGIAGTFLLVGCTGFSDPSGAIVDLKGVDREQYDADLADCQDYANEVPLGKHVGTGAVAGAVVGAAGAAVSGANTTGIGQSAGVGAVYGGTIRGLGAVGEKQQVLRECMRGRGYRVLNSRHYGRSTHCCVNSVPPVAVIR